VKKVSIKALWDGSSVKNIMRGEGGPVDDGQKDDPACGERVITRNVRSLGQEKDC